MDYKSVLDLKTLVKVDLQCFNIEMSNSQARSTRIKILPLHHLQLMLENTVIPVEIVNLSTTGIAFKSSPPVAEKKSLQAIMKIEGQSLPVTLNIMRVTDDLVACAFSSTTPELAQALANYFKTEIQTAQMIEMKTEKLQTEDDGTPHFFLSSNESELFYVEDKGNLVRFELSIFGNHIYCNADRKLHYGSLISDNIRDKAKFKGSVLVGKATISSQESKEIAIRFLESIQALDPNIKKEIIDLLIKTGT